MHIRLGWRALNRPAAIVAAAVATIGVTAAIAGAPTDAVYDWYRDRACGGAGAG